MEEKPRVVVTKSRHSETPVKKFTFSSELVPTSGVLADYHQNAWQTFNRLSLPNMSEEAWRRTDLRELPAESVYLPATGAFQNLANAPEELLKPLTSNEHGGQVVLLPGGEKLYLSPDLCKKGVVFTSFNTAERENPDLIAKMVGQTVKAAEGKFAALVGALGQNGVVLYIPKGLKVEQPLNSLLWGPGINIAHLSHILVWVDEGASVTYIHEAASPDENGPALHSGIVEIKVSDNASLRFVELQSWGRHVWNFSHERVSVGRNGNLDWIFGAIGSRLTKNFSELDLIGEGATGRMSGFYFTDGNQHLDHDTQQNHLAPHTTSDLLFKGALKGNSRSVWQGMIYVAVGAEKTDGYQANRNLILSPNARADSIPGLEILADDVRCTHGATVGKLEQESLFYLKTRGIPDKEAERLLVEGFFDPIMQRIPFEGVRARFQQAIHEKTASQ
ncbi:MAG: Fe-S cluster assembly protein SufD [Flavisolibacter sp.]